MQYVCVNLKCQNHCYKCISVSEGFIKLVTLSEQHKKVSIKFKVHIKYFKSSASIFKLHVFMPMCLKQYDECKSF